MENLFDKLDCRTDTVGVLLPTRGRVEILKRTLKSLSETDGAEALEVVVVTDDDRESYFTAADSIYADKFARLILWNSEKRLYSVKAFIKAYELCSSNIFCWMNDENIYEPFWLKRAVRKFKELFPDDIGVLSLYKMKKAGLGMSSKKWVKYNGEWFHEGYTLYYPDDELTCRAILLGRYGFLKENGIYHDINITKKIPIIPWEERDKMKRKDRGIFYTRNDQGFFLDPEKVHPWPGGFVPVNKPLRKYFL